MNNYVINRVTGTLDAYDRGGSRLFRSFATVEAAEAAFATIDRSRQAKAMVSKFKAYLANPTKANTKKLALNGVDLSTIKKVSDLPNGFVIPNPDGGKPYVVGEKRGRPAAFAVKWLKELL